MKSGLKTVDDLPLGEGEGIIRPRKGGKKIKVRGRVMQGSTGGKHLIVLKGNSFNPKIEKTSFGAGTRVLRWRRKR